MKDITSFEKTKTLNAAGVKHEGLPMTGLHYYSENGDLFVLGRGFYESEVFRFQGFLINTSSVHLTTLKGFIRAFTPPDLLPLLPPDTVVQMWGGKPSVKFIANEDRVFSEIRIEGDSLADIMADALLAIFAVSSDS